MILRIDHASADPLYLQIRTQIIAAIARGELTSGQALPSVRKLATELGINLHTVNKAYAVLRDEGYVEVHGRSGVFVANRAASDDKTASKAAEASAHMARELLQLALAHRARGGALEDFLICAHQQALAAYGQAARDARAAGGAGAASDVGATDAAGAKAAMDATDSDTSQ